MNSDRAKVTVAEATSVCRYRLFYGFKRSYLSCFVVWVYIVFEFEVGYLIKFFSS